MYAAVLAIGIFLGQNFADEQKDVGNNAILPLGLTDKQGKLQRMVQLLRERYVDKIGIDTLQDFAIGEILTHLDPHSTYMSSREVKAVEERLSGTFDGIGLEYYEVNDTLLVTGVSAKGPADRAGVLRGDKLIWINDTRIAGVEISKQKIVDLVRGRRGTVVKIWVNRAGEELSEPLTITRNKISVSSIDAAYMIDSVTAYIKIKQFGEHTADEFYEALTSLKEQGGKRLILDLRDNGGGYFFAAISVLDELLPEGKLMVYTKGANEKRMDYISRAGGVFESGKLAILIDENSASASEIVAGAVQDLNRGTIIGRRSFGKGLVQEQFSFGDGSAVNLSIARYYTPSGRSIQKPYDSGNIQYFNELNQRFLSGELTSGKTNAADTIASDGRIYRAGNGKAILSEGGIMPDIYVKLDTSGMNSFYRSVTQKDLINKYVYGTMVVTPLSHTVEDFIGGYTLPASAYLRFIQMARSEIADVSQGEVRASRTLIEREIKALIGRYFFGDEAWFKILNSDDYVIKRSLEALEG